MAFTARYERVVDVFEGVLSGVEPQHWESATPCTAWTVRDLAGHMIGGQHLIRALAQGREPPDVNTDPGRFVAGDAVQSWRAARKECAAALTPAALHRPIPFGRLGELPLRDYLGGYILEPLIHTWDLAVATGQPTRLDPDLVHHAFATAQVVAPMMRAAGTLGTALPPPAGAGEQTRLLAFMGRSPT